MVSERMNRKKGKWRLKTDDGDDSNDEKRELGSHSKIKGKD